MAGILPCGLGYVMRSDLPPKLATRRNLTPRLIGIRYYRYLNALSAYLLIVSFVIANIMVGIVVPDR